MLVCEKLQTMNIDKKKFLFFVKNLFQCRDFIPASKKIDDIFEAITRNGLWDFINYRPLRQIVKQFARDDEEINLALKNYGCVLAGYLAGTKLVHHIANMAPLSCSTVTPSCARTDEALF